MRARLFVVRKCAEDSGICFGFGACLWKAFRRQECAIVVELCIRRETSFKARVRKLEAW